MIPHFLRLCRVVGTPVLLSIAGYGGIASAQATELMPMPEKIVHGTGMLPLDGGVAVSFEGKEDGLLDRARDRFLDQLNRRTGIAHVQAATASTPRMVIRTAAASKPVQQLGEDESYHLEVTASQIVLAAPTSLGVLHGLQTLLQLVQTTPQGFSLEALTIDDRPRFPWRGLMIDVGRHFMPVDLIRQNLDLMEAAKLNVFHWHLSDDQGFRIESRTHPLLQQMGSDGLFYTQEQVRQIIAYAGDRGIRVIPEFDMPGHADSWFVGYPSLASGKGPYQITRTWGILDPAMDPTRESTYAFLDSFIGEMAALFPDAYFHIGGDECNGKEWDANPEIQRFMRARGLKDDAALQALFTKRVQTLVTRHGKITIGWDEVLQADTPKDVVIQSWRGQKSLAQAAKLGNRGILSSGYYLDLNQPAAEHYAVDPLDTSQVQLTEEEQSRVLGGEAAEWTEYISPEILTNRVWPRAAAVAERLWSRGRTEDASMYRRLDAFEKSLTWYGVEPAFAARPTFQRLVGEGDQAPLETLASIVEPVKGYERGGLRHYDAFTPLNRMVDAVPAESRQAREFHTLASRIAAGAASRDDFDLARLWLRTWEANGKILDPSLKQSALTAELIPVSDELSQAATIGLAALEAIQKQSKMNRATQQTDLGVLKQMRAPKAALVDAVIPSIEMLVQAARS